jgi:uncharacterized protein YeaO (DUF488 family)
MIQMKRTHDPPDDADGNRILVDRLWPICVRGHLLINQLAESTETQTCKRTH